MLQEEILFNTCLAQFTASLNMSTSDFHAIIPHLKKKTTKYESLKSEVLKPDSVMWN